MKIFLSWSGPHSRAIAEALNDWLRRVIQAVKPFYSPEIEKGAKWSNEIDAALEGTSFGIICLTPDNLGSPWIHFEAGALSKTPGALIWTFLCGLNAADVPPPLGRFQHTTADKEDTLQLIKTINRRLADAGGDPLPEILLEENFKLFWPQLERKLVEVADALRNEPPDKPKAASVARNERAILDEILELARNQERRLVALESRPTARTLTVKPRQDVEYQQISVELPDSESAKRLIQRLSVILVDSKIYSGPSKDDKVLLTVVSGMPLFARRPWEVIQLAADEAGIPPEDYSYIEPSGQTKDRVA
jgi:hypothetical protein